jgi:hypothetical protein
MSDGWKKLREGGNIEGAIYAYIVDHPHTTFQDLFDNFCEGHTPAFTITQTILRLEARGRLTAKLEAH